MFVVMFSRAMCGTGGFWRGMFLVVYTVLLFFFFPWRFGPVHFGFTPFDSSDWRRGVDEMRTFEVVDSGVIHVLWIVWVNSLITGDIWGEMPRTGAVDELMSIYSKQSQRRAAMDRSRQTVTKGRIFPNNAQNGLFSSFYLGKH